MKNKPVVTRRNFLETTGAVTGAAMAAGAFPHPADAVAGAAARARQGLDLDIRTALGEVDEIDIKLSWRTREPGSPG